MESSLYENWDEIEMLFGHLVSDNWHLAIGNCHFALSICKLAEVNQQEKGHMQYAKRPYAYAKCLYSVLCLYSLDS